MADEDEICRQLSVYPTVVIRNDQLLIYFEKQQIRQCTSMTEAAACDYGLLRI